MVPIRLVNKNKMEVLTVLVFFMVSGNVLCAGNSLLVACNTDDIECLSKSTETFLEQTHKGIPAYDIIAIDPLVMETLDVQFDKEGLIYKNTNLTVTGLKDQKISDFKMDTIAQSVVLTTRADLHIASDVILAFTKSSKSLSGHYTSRGNALITATYNYELKTGKDGVERFDVGPETITCKVVNTPEFNMNPELQQTVANDPDAKLLYNASDKWNEIVKRTFCKSVEEAYKSVVHNIRAAAKILPASDFFNNLHKSQEIKV